MDKRKLVTMIVKDLEEIRVLSEEVAESENETSLIIDLALYRARLLCQEIELLHELSGNSPSMQKETEGGSFDREEDENSNIQFSDPELEIMNFEDREFHETEELQNEEELEENEDDDWDEVDEEDELEEENEDENEDEVVTEIAEDEQIHDQQEITDDELEEENLTEVKIINEDTVDKEEVEVENSQPEKEINPIELKNEVKSGMREIHIDDPDDEDTLEPVRFSPFPGLAARPPMREIPKPEITFTEQPEKVMTDEKYHKERSINDSIAENQSTDSKLITGRITNLQATIGLNDKIQFIREIFENNSEKYNTVIEHLDKMEQIQEAVEYLKANLSMQKNEASMKFVELLKRRFPK